MCNEVRVYVLMGTCGCGKWTFAQKLVKLLNCPYIESYTTSKIKYRKDVKWNPIDWWGQIAMTRISSWFLCSEIELNFFSKQKQKLCSYSSSLKKVYRDILREVPSGLCRVTFVYLKRSYRLIDARLKSRKNHFMASNILESVETWPSIGVCYYSRH